MGISSVHVPRSLSFLPKCRDCVKTRCVNDSSAVLRNNDLCFLELSTFAGASADSWKTVTPVSSAHSLQLEPSVSLHTSHGHLCRRLRHGAHLLPRSMWKPTTGVEKRVDSLHIGGPQGPAVTLLCVSATEQLLCSRESFLTSFRSQLLHPLLTWKSPI